MNTSTYLYIEYLVFALDLNSVARLGNINNSTLHILCAWVCVCGIFFISQTTKVMTMSNVSVASHELELIPHFIQIVTIYPCPGFLTLRVNTFYPHFAAKIILQTVCQCQDQDKLICICIFMVIVLPWLLHV